MRRTALLALRWPALSPQDVTNGMRSVLDTLSQKVQRHTLASQMCLSPGLHDAQRLAAQVRKILQPAAAFLAIPGLPLALRGTKRASEGPSI
jgi:hypothetical protein